MKEVTITQNGEMQTELQNEMQNEMQTAVSNSNVNYEKKMRTAMQTEIQWATLVYLLGYKISLPEGFWYPSFPNKN